ncbi:MAG: Dihydroorotate dehydrogenase B (NAD(+)), catalytic subunit [Candidatus Omnitrophica bacterium ADurb.Bin277]|nr:MAG: Dihydroorotate dehydrogenase B (NAD(+)), catalytic subunit [Candidatus Omnitrophica bacterium ADurb.Bin277]
MSVDLTTRIKNLKLKNPVTVASGTFGTSDEYAGYVDYKKLGAIITKTITVRPRPGNPMPRICEVSSGMLNAIGLQNKGLADFIEQKIPYFRKLGVPLIVSIAGESAGEFGLLAKTFDRFRSVVNALEVNLSCPNVESGGVNFMKKQKRILDAIKAVRCQTKLLIFAKLSPELGDVLEIADNVLKRGADGISVINTLRGMSIDINGRTSRIVRDFGGLSGPAIKPVALRYVYQVKKEFGVPVIASGGISDWRDAVEFLIAGADLLAVGTSNFVEPRATMEILKGIRVFCRKEKIKSIKEIRGSYRPRDQKGKGCSR